VTVLRKVRNLH